MEITSDEMKLIMKYLDTRDESIIEHVIKHPWGYSFQMVQVAIGIEYHNIMPHRIVCYNSILLPEK